MAVAVIPWLRIQNHPEFGVCYVKSEQENIHIRKASARQWLILDPDTKEEIGVAPTRLEALVSAGYLMHKREQDRKRRRKRRDEM